MTNPDMASRYVPGTKSPTLVFPFSQQASRHVALMIESLVRQNNSAGRPTVLGLATGSTPVGIYRELIRMHKEDDLDFSRVSAHQSAKTPQTWASPLFWASVVSRKRGIFGLGAWRARIFAARGGKRITDG